MSLWIVLYLVLGALVLFGLILGSFAASSRYCDAGQDTRAKFFYLMGFIFFIGLVCAMYSTVVMDTVRSLGIAEKGLAVILILIGVMAEILIASPPDQAS
jgi:hypothetical protein